MSSGAMASSQATQKRKGELEKLLRQLNIRLLGNDLDMLAREVDKDFLGRMAVEEERFQAEQKARSKLHARRSDARKSSTWRKMARIIEAKNALAAKINKTVNEQQKYQDNGVINLCTHSDNQAQKSQLNQGQGSGSAPVVLTAEARDLMLVQRAIGRHRREQQEQKNKIANAYAVANQLAGRDIEAKTNTNNTQTTLRCTDERLSTTFQILQRTH